MSLRHFVIKGDDLEGLRSSSVHFLQECGIGGAKCAVSADVVTVSLPADTDGVDQLMLTDLRDELGLGASVSPAASESLRDGLAPPPRARVDEILAAYDVDSDSLIAIEGSTVVATSRRMAIVIAATIEKAEGVVDEPVSTAARVEHHVVFITQPLPADKNCEGIAKDAAYDAKEQYFVKFAASSFDFTGDVHVTATRDRQLELRGAFKSKAQAKRFISSIEPTTYRAAIGGSRPTMHVGDTNPRYDEVRIESMEAILDGIRDGELCPLPEGCFGEGQRLTTIVGPTQAGKSTTISVVIGREIDFAVGSSENVAVVAKNPLKETKYQEEFAVIRRKQNGTVDFADLPAGVLVDRDSWPSGTALKLDCRLVKASNIAQVPASDFDVMTPAQADDALEVALESLGSSTTVNMHAYQLARAKFLIDTPGTHDTGGIQVDVRNAVARYRLAHRAGGVCMCLVVDCSKVDAMAGQGLSGYLAPLAACFTDFQTEIKKVTILFTRFAVGKAIQVGEGINPAVKLAEWLNAFTGQIRSQLQPGSAVAQHQTVAPFLRHALAELEKTLAYCASHGKAKPGKATIVHPFVHQHLFAGDPAMRAEYQYAIDLVPKVIDAADPIDPSAMRPTVYPVDGMHRMLIKMEADIKRELRAGHGQAAVSLAGQMCDVLARLDRVNVLDDAGEVADVVKVYVPRDAGTADFFEGLRTEFTHLRDEGIRTLRGAVQSGDAAQTQEALDALRAGDAELSQGCEGLSDAGRDRLLQSIICRGASTADVVARDVASDVLPTSEDVVKFQAAIGDVGDSAVEQLAAVAKAVPHLLGARVVNELLGAPETFVRGLAADLTRVYDKGCDTIVKYVTDSVTHFSLDRKHLRRDLDALETATSAMRTVASKFGRAVNPPVTGAEGEASNRHVDPAASMMLVATSSVDEKEAATRAGVLAGLVSLRDKLLGCLNDTSSGTAEAQAGDRLKTATETLQSIARDADVELALSQPLAKLSASGLSDLLTHELTQALRALSADVLQGSDQQRSVELVASHRSSLQLKYRAMKIFGDAEGEAVQGSAADIRRRIEVLFDGSLSAAHAEVEAAKSLFDLATVAQDASDGTMTPSHSDGAASTNSSGGDFDTKSPMYRNLNRASAAYLLLADWVDAFGGSSLGEMSATFGDRLSAMLVVVKRETAKALSSSGSRLPLARLITMAELAQRLVEGMTPNGRLYQQEPQVLEAVHKAHANALRQAKDEKTCVCNAIVQRIDEMPMPDPDPYYPYGEVARWLKELDAALVDVAHVCEVCDDDDRSISKLLVDKRIALVQSVNEQHTAVNKKVEAFKRQKLFHSALEVLLADGIDIFESEVFSALVDPESGAGVLSSPSGSSHFATYTTNAAWYTKDAIDSEVSRIVQAAIKMGDTHVKASTAIMLQDASKHLVWCVSRLQNEALRANFASLASKLEAAAEHLDQKIEAEKQKFIDSLERDGISNPALLLSKLRALGDDIEDVISTAASKFDNDLRSIKGMVQRAFRSGNVEVVSLNTLTCKALALAAMLDANRHRAVTGDDAAQPQEEEEQPRDTYHSRVLGVFEKEAAVAANRATQGLAQKALESATKVLVGFDRLTELEDDQLRKILDHQAGLQTQFREVAIELCATEVTNVATVFAKYQRNEVSEAVFEPRVKTATEVISRVKQSCVDAEMGTSVGREIDAYAARLEDHRDEFDHARESNQKARDRLIQIRRLLRAEGSIAENFNNALHVIGDTDDATVRKLVSSAVNAWFAEAVASNAISESAFPYVARLHTLAQAASQLDGMLDRDLLTCIKGPMTRVESTLTSRMHALHLPSFADNPSDIEATLMTAGVIAKFADPAVGGAISGKAGTTKAEIATAVKAVTTKATHVLSQRPLESQGGELDQALRWAAALHDARSITTVPDALRQQLAGPHESIERFLDDIETQATLHPEETQQAFARIRVVSTSTKIVPARTAMRDGLRRVEDYKRKHEAASICIAKYTASPATMTLQTALNLVREYHEAGRRPMPLRDGPLDELRRSVINAAAAAGKACVDAVTATKDVPLAAAVLRHMLPLRSATDDLLVDEPLRASFVCLSTFVAENQAALAESDDADTVMWLAVSYQGIRNALTGAHDPDGCADAARADTLRDAAATALNSAAKKRTDAVRPLLGDFSPAVRSSADVKLLSAQASAVKVILEHPQDFEAWLSTGRDTCLSEARAIGARVKELLELGEYDAVREMLATVRVSSLVDAKASECIRVAIESMLAAICDPPADLRNGLFIKASSLLCLCTDAQGSLCLEAVSQRHASDIAALKDGITELSGAVEANFIKLVSLVPRPATFESLLQCVEAAQALFRLPEAFHDSPTLLPQVSSLVVEALHSVSDAVRTACTVLESPADTKFENGTLIRAHAAAAAYDGVFADATVSALIFTRLDSQVTRLVDEGRSYNDVLLSAVARATTSSVERLRLLHPAQSRQDEAIEQVCSVAALTLELDTLHRVYHLNACGGVSTNFLNAIIACFRAALEATRNDWARAATEIEVRNVSKAIAALLTAGERLETLLWADDKRFTILVGELMDSMIDGLRERVVSAFADETNRARLLTELRARTVSCAVLSGRIDELFQQIIAEKYPSLPKERKIRLYRELEQCGPRASALLELPIFRVEAIQSVNALLDSITTDTVMEQKLKCEPALEPFEQQQLRSVVDGMLPQMDAMAQEFYSLKNKGHDTMQRLKQRVGEAATRANQSGLASDLLALLQTVAFAFSWVDGHEHFNGDFTTLRRVHKIQIAALARLLDLDRPKPAADIIGKLRSLASLPGEGKASGKKMKKKGESPTTMQFPGHLVEVPTGQGKSITLGILAAVLALLGRHVDVVCYSKQLTDRDDVDMRPFFAALDVPSDRIQYLTFGEVMERRALGVREAVLNSLGAGGSLARFDACPERRVLLLDEADMLLNDGGSRSGAREAGFFSELYRPTARLADGRVKDLLRCVYQHRNNAVRLEALKRTEVDNMHPKVKRLVEAHPSLSKFILAQVLDMVDEVQDFGKQIGAPGVDDSANDFGYLVSQAEGIGYYEADGTISYKSAVHGWYRAAFALMHEIERGATTGDKYDRISMPLQPLAFAYSQLPAQCYCATFGVTGTLATLTDKHMEALGTMCGIEKRTYTQKVFPEQQLCTQGDVYIVERTGSEDDVKKEWFRQIEACIKAVRAENNDADEKKGLLLPVVVAFASTNLLRQFLTACPAIDAEAAKLTRDTPPGVARTLITAATEGNTITLIDSTFGRGTDFKCQRCNVLTVVQTYLPETHSEEIQLRGRTGRQGAQGKVKLVLHPSDVEGYLASPEEEEEEEEEQKEDDGDGAAVAAPAAAAAPSAQQAHIDENGFVLRARRRQLEATRVMEAAIELQMAKATDQKAVDFVRMLRARPADLQQQIASALIDGSNVDEIFILMIDISLTMIRHDSVAGRAHLFFSGWISSLFHGPRASWKRMQTAFPTVVEDLQKMRPSSTVVTVLFANSKVSSGETCGVSSLKPDRLDEIDPLEINAKSKYCHGLRAAAQEIEKMDDLEGKAIRIVLFTDCNHAKEDPLKAEKLLTEVLDAATVSTFACVYPTDLPVSKYRVDPVLRRLQATAALRGARVSQYAVASEKGVAEAFKSALLKSRSY